MSRATLDGGTADPGFAQAQGFIGRRLLRSEDRRFLIGKGQFTDDLSVRGMLHAAFVRSPHAHARITTIDTSAALASPGVVAVVTGRDVAGLAANARVAQEGAYPMEMEPLPTDKVRFDGDPVACVIAEDRYLAEDAADLVRVKYDVLPAVLDMYTAADQSLPLVADEVPTNLHTHQTLTYGDVEGAFATAARIVRASFRTQRLTHVPIETRGVLASWDEGRQELLFQCAAQTAHVTRTLLASRLGLSENQVRVVSPDVGGGFGQKIPLYREELTVAVMARKLGRAIKWIEDRTENLLAANHARDDAAVIEAAVMDDGRILGIRAELWADFGAYAFYPPSYILSVVGWLLLGAYKVDNYQYTMNVALTNKSPIGAMRAPMAIATWATEGTIERIAEELGLDPLEVRRRNMLTLADQPYQSAPGYLYEALTLRESFEAILSDFDITAFRRRQGDALAEGRYVGVGIASVLEPTTYGSAWYKASGDEGTGHEAATIKMEPSGAINVMVGIVDTGQGYETTLAQVVADALGTTPENVTARLGDTHIAPYGMGTRGSRGAAAGNGVAYLAALDLRAKILRIAAHLLEANEGDLRIEDDFISVVGDPGRGIRTADVARIAYLDPLALPAGVEPGLEITRTYDPPFLTFSNAAHLCVAEVDIGTGQVRIEDYRVVEDAGTLINPMIVDGQIHGGVAMGIGQALLEEIVYDDHGRNVTGTFMDYLIPTMSDVPTIAIRHIETPNPNTPRGIKGMAEGPVLGGVASVALAVQDALRPLGVTVDELPLSPRRLLGYIRQARAGEVKQ